jgi:hypothetical protein
MSKHRDVPLVGRGWRALCSAVPLFLILATMIIVPPVAIAQEAPSTGATGATGATGTVGSTGPSGETGPVDPAGPPVITSDKADYAPGELVTLTGTNWANGESVHIVVNDTLGKTWQHTADVVADDAGTFTDVFNLPEQFVSNYDVTATGPISGTATTTFTDAAIGGYDQCANDLGTGYPANDPDPGCQWVGGNLNSNKATYKEGEALVERLWLTGLTTGTHSVSLDYGTTKGGKHAFDYLTTWNFSENWVTNPDLCQAITIGGCTASSPPTDKLQIPDDSLTPTDNVVSPQFFTMYNGDMTTATAPAIISGSYAGDSDTRITITFTVDTATCAKPAGASTCEVVLWFGAHIASQLAAPAGWGVGQGASSISGSPYHVALGTLDGGSIGGRDNQMQAGAVPLNGTLIIVKDAVPNDAQDFNFNLTDGGLINQNFSLDDDGTNTSNPPTQLSNSTAPQFSLPPGTYTASELGPLASGWSLATIVCSPSTGTTTSVPNMNAIVNLASSATVTCTFTNSLTNSPTISTQLKDTGDDNAKGGTGANLDTNITDGGIVDPGTVVFDTATLSGQSANATGTATYRFKKVSTDPNSTPSPAVCDNATATIIDSNGGAAGNDAAVAANGTVGDSGLVTLTDPGVYEFWVTYSGNATNNGATSICGTETVRVKNSPTISTQLKDTGADHLPGGIGANLDTNISDGGIVPTGTVVFDTATLSGQSGDATGTATYRFKRVSTDPNSTPSPAVCDNATATIIDSNGGAAGNDATVSAGGAVGDSGLSASRASTSSG